MNSIQKKITLSVTSLMVIGVMLISTVGALAVLPDGPLTMVGTLDVTGGIYKVDAQEFLVGLGTTCYDIGGLVIPCNTLVTGPLVQVIGNVSGGIYTATSVAVLNTYSGVVTTLPAATLPSNLVLDTTHTFAVDANTVLPPFYAVNDTVKVTFKVVGLVQQALMVELVTSAPTSTYTYEGAIVSFSDTLWKVGLYDFAVDSTTTLPEFYVANDIVKVTFKVVGTVYRASAIDFVSSAPGSLYEFEGVLQPGFTNTSWTLKNETTGKVHTFDMSGITSLPIYFAAGDTFKLQFEMVGTAFVATKILDHTVLVGNKVDSARCDNRVNDHPGVQKVADDVGATYDQILALFCKGFGLGEIKLAYRYAQGSDYTPEMLLALRAQGYSWGDLKKRAAGNVAPGDPVTGNVHQNISRNQNLEQKDNPGASNKPDKQDNSNKPNNPGNSNGKGKGHNK